jgi:SAM-dependent methyltransferase
LNTRLPRGGGQTDGDPTECGADLTGKEPSVDGLRGPAFYDDDAVFARYLGTRNDWPDNPNDTLEQPVLLELIGDFQGLRILDLGCGDARFGRLALDHGCAAYLGIDGSNNMVAAAHEVLAGGPGQVVHAAIEEWDYPQETFDLVVSSLALHYVPDVEAVLEGAFRALVPGGRIVLSIEHPVITSCHRGWVEEQRADWLVDDYFVEGPRVTSWLGGRVVRIHRTAQTYFSAMQAAGFVVGCLREAEPQRERFSDAAEFERRRRIPLFLFLAGHKPQ